jgi:N-hydroxyarylamine O-acetyltransferase
MTHGAIDAITITIALDLSRLMTNPDRSPTSSTTLPDATLEHVLSRLGFSARPPLDRAGLDAVYDAWCRRVPFDNVRKRIHLQAGDLSPLPGSTPVDFFEAWLQHGAGGTCWAGAGALRTLLTTLGFEATRALGTMLAAPGLLPNHGTVIVSIDQNRFLLDTAMLHARPLAIRDHAGTAVEHPAWGVRAGWADGRWHVRWRPLHKTDGFDLRLEGFDVSAAEFRDRHEQTRGWGPFNYAVSARTLRGDEVVGLAFGHRVTLRANGTVEQTPINETERRQFLTETVGLSEELVAQLPDDVPTPPPPGSSRSTTPARPAPSAPHS